MPSSTDQPRESVIERYFKKRMKETGGHTRKVRWLCRTGAPDRLAWWAFPNAAFVELKAFRKGVRPGSMQEREINRLRDSGWKVYVINSCEGVEHFIEEMTNMGLTR